MILCSLNGLQTIATVETMNFRILCFIKILQPPLGWQNLDRTIAYTRFHKIKGGGGVPVTLGAGFTKFHQLFQRSLVIGGGGGGGGSGTGMQQATLGKSSSEAVRSYKVG